VTTLIPTAWAELEVAVRGRRPVWVSYHGHERVLCPHALGWHNGRPMLLGYQAGGWTSSGSLDADPRKRWRCLFVDDIATVVAEPDQAWESADNYNQDRPFNAIDEVAIAVPAGGIRGTARRRRT
jgi:hypothetical protein